MSTYLKARLFDLRSAVLGAGIELTLTLAPSLHKSTGRPFMSVTASKAGLFGGAELAGTCHDLDWWFVDTTDFKEAESLLRKWGVAFQSTDVGY